MFNLSALVILDAMNIFTIYCIHIHIYYILYTYLHILWYMHNEFI